jgi:hypothetical protein
VARHIFQAYPVWIYTQSNITSILLTIASNFPTKGLRSKRRSSPLIFQVVPSLSTRSLLAPPTVYLTLMT